MPLDDARRRFDENPFYVLELEPSASRAQIERQGRKLLGLLEVGVKRAQSYATPLGERRRTAELVREAMGALRDPDRRAACELWALAPAGKADETEPAAPRAPGLGAQAAAALGLRGR